MTSRIPILQYITQKLFNFERVLHDLNVDDCASSSYIYDPACHVITGEFNIINNTSLRRTKIYRDHKSILNYWLN